MRRFAPPVVFLLFALALVAGACSSSPTSRTAGGPTGGAAATAPDSTGMDHGSMPDTTLAAEQPPPDTTPPKVNVYAGTTADKVSPLVAKDLFRVYVPNGEANTVSVIDPRTFQVIDTFPTGAEPQHIVPSWDLRTLWLLNNQGNTLVPIDAATGTRGAPVTVEDPYNLYFTPDGSDAVVVAERFRRLDFHDPKTMAFRSSLAVDQCDGINHADYDGTYSYAIYTCEFAGKLAKIDVKSRQVLGYLDLGAPGTSMPQDIRVSPDGTRFYVADMMAGGVHVIDGTSFTKIGFVPTGVGAHGLYPSRDGTKLYVANRGADHIMGAPRGPGSVSVLDFATGQVVATWVVPGGGSPDMGNVTADGSQLWLSGRYDSEVYVFDTATGSLLTRIPVDKGPHGLAVWPQPGTYSLGHTGNMR